jgi:UDP-2,3-diacylglucosamine hydrolase
VKAWFISDIHLRKIEERNSQTLLRFLNSLKEDSQTTHLFFLGDIFDLWVGDSQFFNSKFKELVNAILELKRKGIEVVYFEGNHDIHVKDFWENYEIPVWVHEKYYQLGPWRVRMEHGDFINERDLAYKRLRKFLRTPVIEKFAYTLPGKFWDYLGTKASKYSRQHSAQYRLDREKDLRQMIRSYAQRKFGEEQFDILVTGHMHIRDEFPFQIQDKKAVSINLGSWFEQPQALLLEESGYTWKNL